MTTTSQILISLLVAGATGVLPAAAQTTISPAAGPTPTISETATEGFMMLGGRVFVVRQGQAVPLEGEMIMRVSPSGITGFDNVSRVLTHDQMLTIDGRLVSAPESLVVAQPPVPVDAAAARQVDRGVRGVNSTGLAPVRPMPPSTASASVPAAVTSTTVTTVPATAVPVPQPVAPPSAGVNVSAALPAGQQGSVAPVVRDRAPAPTTFDPNQVNDGSIEAAGTGTRRRTVD